MLFQALMAVRDLSRLHDIAAILVRYGFGDIVARMGLTQALESAGRVLHYDNATRYAHLPAPTRVRCALEEMGPTFVKLGQLLATRVDLFDPEWIAEFGKLQDCAPPVPYADIRSQLTEDLGAPPEELFASFNPDPLAAASIAQVYLAGLEDGFLEFRCLLVQPLHTDEHGVHAVEVVRQREEGRHLGGNHR